MNDDRRIQSVRNAWINALRSEVLRVGTADIARVAHVAVWLASFADADGGNCFPSRETLAVLAGCTPETVTRCVRVLVAVGMLRAKRRPNNATVYQLLMPVQRPEWEKHLHLYSETRQKRAYRAKKLAEAQGAGQSRTASMDAVRTASTAGVPDSVHGLGSGQRPRTPSGDSDSVHGRPRTASTDVFRTASMAGGTSTALPPVGTYSPDHEMADHSPQPQVREGARPAKDPDPAIRAVPDPDPDVPRCSGCGRSMAVRASGRTGHEQCAARPPSAVQPPLLLGVPTPPPGADAATQPQADTA